MNIRCASHSLIVLLATTGCKKAINPIKPAQEYEDLSPVVTTHSEVALFTGLGVVTPNKEVEIKSRIEGKILSTNFKPGHAVRKGDLLFTIDPAPYQALLEQTQATEDRDSIALHDAEIALDREHQLFEAGVISKQQLQVQQTNVDQLNGTVKVDNTQTSAAKIQLASTKIFSPIDGQLSLKAVDAGNVVHTSDTTPLVTILQVQPAVVTFTIPADAIQQIRNITKRRVLRVLVVSSDGHDVISTGEFDSFDNQIDSVTGLARGRAVFPNRSLELWPNQFVTVQLSLAL